MQIKPKIEGVYSRNNLPKIKDGAKKKKKKVEA